VKNCKCVELCAPDGVGITVQSHSASEIGAAFSRLICSDYLDPRKPFLLDGNATQRTRTVGLDHDMTSRRRRMRCCSVSRLFSRSWVVGPPAMSGRGISEEKQIASETRVRTLSQLVP
jgi:hypothetical protein